MVDRPTGLVASAKFVFQVWLEHWHGCGSLTEPGKRAHDGLANVMQQQFGAQWTPAESLRTWRLSQVADERTSTTIYRNLTFHLNAFTNSPFMSASPLASIAAGSGAQVADVVYEDGRRSFPGHGRRHRRRVHPLARRWRRCVAPAPDPVGEEPAVLA